MLKLDKFIATFAYLGFFPFAAGSIASLAGLGIAYLLRDCMTGYLGVFLVITILGFVCSDRFEKVLGIKDASCIVIDEVSGALIALFMLPMTPAVWVTAFFLFRAFDMFKIYPASRFEKFPGGIGVMMDDVVAGLFTNLVMQIAVRWTGLV